MSSDFFWSSVVALILLPLKELTLEGLPVGHIVRVHLDVLNSSLQARLLLVAPIPQYPPRFNNSYSAVFFSFFWFCIGLNPTRVNDSTSMWWKPAFWNSFMLYSHTFNHIGKMRLLSNKQQIIYEFQKRPLSNRIKYYNANLIITLIGSRYFIYNTNVCGCW